MRGSRRRRGSTRAWRANWRRSSSTPRDSAPRWTGCQKRLGPGGDGQRRIRDLDQPRRAFAPLVKIASGGELSRFILALKVALAEKGGAETMIFDEIDRGVGGAVASAIGERLARLAEGKQLLAVTHCPQVAARGAHHLLIAKSHDGTVTRTGVTPLDAGPAAKKSPACCRARDHRRSASAGGPIAGGGVSIRRHHPPAPSSKEEGEKKLKAPSSLEEGVGGGGHTEQPQGPAHPPDRPCSNAPQKRARASQNPNAVCGWNCGTAA